ncbi:MAG: hypothetical protein FWC76_03425 [Defluviitaleaceae bacterium]|nr:hypothetical protein [Defluviitaleaceae bacterium]
MLNKDYQAPSMPDMYTARTFFIDHLHKHGKSGLFLTGIILFSIGNVISSILVLNIFSIPALLLMALPIIGFWLIYAAAKSPRRPERTLPALTLFKIYTIAHLVLVTISMAAAFVLLFFLFRFMAVEFGAQDMMIVFNIVLLVSAAIVAAIMALFIAFYYVPILNIVKGIKHNIENNAFAPIRGVLPLTITTSIAVFAGASSAFMGLVTTALMGVGYANTMDDLQYIMDWYSPEMDWLGPLMMLNMSIGRLAMSHFFSLVGMVGVVILLVALNKFASSMARNT